MRRIFKYFFPILLLIATACGDTTVEENELRLSDLLENGLDPDERQKLEERFAKLSANNKQAQDILAAYANDPVLEGNQSDLKTVLNLALEKNSDIARAAQRLNRADSERLNAIFGYLPQVSFTANFNRIEQNVISSDNAVFQTGIANYGSTDFTLELSQPIFDLSRIFGIRIANIVRTNAQVDYLSTVQAVMFEVFDTYIAALQRQNAYNTARQREALIRTQIAAARGREQEGLTAQNALRGLEIELADLGIETSRAGLERARLLSELSLLSGARVQGVAQAAIPRGLVGTERRISVDDAIETALAKNPVVLRSLISATEADFRRKQALASDFSPVLVAFARQVDEDREDSRFSGGSVTSDVVMGVRLVVPIFNTSGQGYSNIEARVDFKDALIQYLNQRRQIETDIVATHQRMIDLSAAASRAQSAVRANRALVSKELALEEAGNSQAYLVAALQSRALAARAQVVDLQLEYLRAWARFELLTGQNIAKRL